MDTHATSKDAAQVDFTGDSNASEFVDRFANAWARSDPDALVALLADDAVLIQPMMPATAGKAACRDQFSRLFTLIPDLRAKVHRWAARDDVLFIEFTLGGTFGGRELSWSAVDRISLRDGLVRERISYFDAAPLGLEILKRPRGWRGLLSSGFRPSFAPSTSDPNTG